MITARGLTKHYGRTVAVQDLTFTVRPGMVTGFLGPNGAGKSTTMRMLIGLDRPDAGGATINGKPYQELPRPLREVGAMLEARSFHPGRSARAHLGALAMSNAIPERRVEEVLGLVGIEAVARRRAGKFSLGMAQRLGIAVALLGDPGIVMLDEPVNGLDPEGIRWMRALLKSLAAEGRTVLISSHLINEIAATADELIVIGRGRLLAHTTVAELAATAGSLEDAFFRLLEAGAGGVGYLLKDRVGNVAEFVSALERVAGGGTALDPEVISQLLRKADPGLASLTPRERDVLRVMAEGKSNSGIAAKLMLSEGAVEKHIASIFGKLSLEPEPAVNRRVLAVLRYLRA